MNKGAKPKHLIFNICPYFLVVSQKKFTQVILSNLFSNLTLFGAKDGSLLICCTFI
jgi:hypothetical protein